MNRKNVVTTGALALSITLCACGNQVSEVPVAYANEAKATDLTFLYKHEEKLQEMQRHIDEQVQKEKIKKEAEEKKKQVALEEAKKKAEEERKKEAEKKEAAKLAQSKKASEKVSKEKEESLDNKSYNVPLDKDLLKYINKLCNQLGISETMVLGLIKTESDFNPTLISKTNDYGLMQINRQNFDWLKKELKEEFGISFNWDDPYDNVTAGIYYLSKVKADWVNKYSGESLQNVTLLAYNMGPGNAKKYLRSHSASDWKYVKKVNGYKQKIEKGESLG